MSQRVSPRPAHEHFVQLFDTPDSLANVVSAFLKEGWDRGDRLLVIAKPAHWARTSDRLERRGCPITQATREGRLAVLDAATTLARVTRGGAVDRQLFLEQFGAILGGLAADSTGTVRMYGELVELLAEEGDLRAAQHLEQLWNELADRHRFTLLCGYSAPHFADMRTLPALHAICRAHHRVQTNTSDLLGSWLVGQEPDQRPA